MKPMNNLFILEYKSTTECQCRNFGKQFNVVCHFNYLMPKRKDLNGIPHNITQSFFGTERYYGCGYMGDWLLNAARQLKLQKATLDVLSATFQPSELNLRPLIYHASTLKEVIDKGLLANGFETDFITEARIDFQFPDPKLYRTTIYCYPYMIDKEGRRYEAGRIIAEGLEPNFDVFQEANQFPSKRTFFDRFRNLFR